MVIVRQSPDDGQHTVYSVGHSNQPLEHFLGLLYQHDIQTVVDVRTAPYSRFNQQFNREAISAALNDAGFAYRFLGADLGGRPNGDHFYDFEGHVRYDRLALSPEFRRGVETLKKVSLLGRSAMLCSEADPAQCHRHLLIARVLDEERITVIHIYPDGSIKPYSNVALTTPNQKSLFDEDEEESTWRSPLSVLRDTQPNPSFRD